MKRLIKNLIFCFATFLVFLSFSDNVLAYSTILEQHSCSAFKVNSDIIFVGIQSDKKLSAYMNLNKSGIATNNDKDYFNFKNWEAHYNEILPDDTITDYDGKTCPDIILVNQDRHKELYYDSKSGDTTEQAIQNFYSEYNKVFSGKNEKCYWAFGWHSCDDYNETNVYVTFRVKKLEKVTEQIEANYRAIGDAVTEFRKYFNYSLDGSSSANNTTVPKIGCPMRFHEVNDLSQYTVEELNQQLEDINVLTQQFTNITNAYNEAVAYYTDESVFPGLAFFISPSDPASSPVKDLRSLKTYYDSNHTSSDNQNVNDSDLSSNSTKINDDFNYAPYPFRKYLNEWVNAVSMYDLDYWKSTIEILADTQEDGTVSSSTVSQFTEGCVIDYRDRLNEELAERRKNGQLTEEEYAEFQKKMNELDEKIQQLLSSISSVYNHFNDFYGENSIVNCESILSKEFIEWLEWAYRITEIVSVILVVILSFIEFMKAIASNDGDALKKSGGKFVKRLIVLAVLFLLPILINFILKIAGISGIDSDNPICIKVGD